MNREFRVLASIALLLLAACNSGQESRTSSAAQSVTGAGSGGTGGSTTTPAPVTKEYPLLGSARGGHYWFDYCAGQPDSTALPEDPRSLVKPGVNQGKAVHFNVFWQECQEGNTPANCGELRARQQRGYPLIAGAGQIGAGSFMSGNASESNFSFPAEAYGKMWQTHWNMSARPANYDELLAQRWGSPLSPARNPYPLSGEDPNRTEGGSGQLPVGLTQLRNADGSWTGQINVTCGVCHGGGVGKASDGQGLGAIYGTNSLGDITVIYTDLARITPQQGVYAAVSSSKVRGTANITNFQLFGTLTLFDDLPGYIKVQNQPSTGTEDPPVWWNLGHRVAKFYDAGQPVNAKRILMSFHFPGAGTPNNEAGKQWIKDHMQDGSAWVISQRSPAWPEDKLGAIDTALAEQGAILFHAKDLWAPRLNNAVRKPKGGNGSCASCHGAYSPRYVNDPAYLDSPLLEGVAANVVPLDVIGTDTRRMDGNSQMIAEVARTNWFSYGDGEKNENGVPLCGDLRDDGIRGDRELGYLAPPLYGVWATAPYFHNGAVPNVLEVLKPAERKTIWRRRSVQAPAGQAGQVVMGYDYSLDSGYDTQKMGWKYDELACGTGSYPFYDCNPVDSAGATVQEALNYLWSNGGLAWNLLNLPLLTNQQIEDRKVYNTKYYSQSNAGHEFTSVLTDQEVRAIMEYLKTL